MTSRYRRHIAKGWQNDEYLINFRKAVAAIVIVCLDESIAV